jgi:hypothetical protein
LARTGCWSRCGSMVPNASSMNTKALVCFSIQLPNWGLQQTFRSFSRGQYQDWDCRRFLPSPPHGKEKFPAPVETAGRKYAARKILPIFRTALRLENRKHPQVLRFQQLRTIDWQSLFWRLAKAVSLSLRYNCPNISHKKWTVGFLFCSSEESREHHVKLQQHELLCP